MHIRVPSRPARVRRNLARVLSLTALVTATSLTMSVAQAAPAPAPTAAPRTDPAPGSGYAVRGEVAHYDFDYGDENRSPNLITGGPDAVLHNGAVANPATDNTIIWGNPGQTRRTLQLGGVNQYASVPLNLPTDQSLTVSAWVLPNKAGAAEAVITEEGGRVSGFALRIGADGKPEFAMPQSDADQPGWDTARGTAAVPATGDWNFTHLTGVYDAQAGEIRLYVNGMKVATAKHTATWKAAGELQLGRGLTAGQGADGFPGKLAEVRIWQRALPDLEAADIAIPDATTRGDACVAGSWLHAGGPKVKALAAKALTSNRPDLRLTAGQYMGYGPLPAARFDDRDAEQKLSSAQDARPGAWAGVTKPFGDGIFGDDYTAFLNAPNYFDPMQKFLLDTGERDFNPPPPPAPSKDALNQALTVAHQHQATEQSSMGFYHWYASDDVVKKWSAYEVARFVRFGGFPTQAPAKDSVEFRTEVEDLKTQWAGCDAWDPVDPNHVLDEVVSTASAEWQAEQNAMAKQRADIVAADSQAYQDVRTASAAMNEAQGQAYIVGRMLFFQKYWQGQPKSNIFYPKPEKFTQATAAMASAKKAIQAQLTIAQKAAASAKSQADKANTAQADAGKVALASGTPYGRGLTYALQSAQVTGASAAAAQSAAKAIEATLNAVQAGQADSKALYALIDTQNHAAQAEFARAAAQAGADQAHNAAAAAAAQADQAAQNAAKAKADRVTAEQAEATAKTAAADADAKLAVAQQERANASAARQSAESHRADAQAHEATAQQQQAAAAGAMNAAQSAEQTAADKAASARDAEAQAAASRDGAAAAEHARDAALSRQKGLDAAAAAAQGSSAAQDARQAANDADSAAGQAT
ncbi:LamG domain-containing protein, partial [Kitasatospora cinereorecta]|uniref:LamG domain-containing protein n=1 Tax=Kitasatospora cinereorecta TaxID=285560 RepID=UPI0031F84FC2